MSCLLRSSPRCPVCRTLFIGDNVQRIYYDDNPADVAGIIRALRHRAHRTERRLYSMLREIKKLYDLKVKVIQQGIIINVDSDSD